MHEIEKIEGAIKEWLKNVVIDLELCPFAAQPTLNNQVRIQVSDADSELSLLEDLNYELNLIDAKQASEIETSLLVLSRCLSDFYDFNQFLALVDDLLERKGWTGEYQIASFHPDYQFANTQADDAENLTNRSPYPVLHILRESSLEKAIDYYGNTEEIPKSNIKKMNELSYEDKQKLFPYLFVNKEVKPKR